MNFKALNRLSNIDENDYDELKLIADELETTVLNDFMYRFVLLLYYFPMEGKLKEVYNKQTKHSAKLGVVCKHMVKTANKIGIDNYFVKNYLDNKNVSEYYQNTIDQQEKYLSELSIKQDDWILDFSNAIETKAVFECYRDEEHRKKHSATFLLLDRILDTV